MKVKPLVYVAAPYTHPDPGLNTHRAIRTSMALYDTGIFGVLVPHTTMLLHVIDPRPLEFWYQFDLDQMQAADAVLRLPGDSQGADKEVQFALKLKIPVFYEAHELIRWGGMRVGLDEETIQEISSHYHDTNMGPNFDG